MRFKGILALNTILWMFLLIFSACKKNESSTDEAPETTTTTPPVTTNSLGAAAISGLNWADARDNYNDGWVIPSGLTAADNYSTVQNKAETILNAFITNQANTVRLPVNPPSVAESWWNSYSGAIDKALSKNMKVILAYWEGTAAKDGKIDDMTKFWAMWSAVVTKYGANPKVYFEIMNEPFGYTETDWKNICAQWLTTYSNVPRERILVGGTGYSENVAVMGADSRFNNCLFSLHIYAWWGNHVNESTWQSQMQTAMGAYASRTVLTEFGAPMTTGENYTGSINNDAEIAFIKGITNKLRTAHVASVYWPGLRDNDTYSLFTFNAGTMAFTNGSGLTRMNYAWGNNPSTFNANSFYKITNANSNLLLDVSQSSTAGGAAITQQTAGTGNSQQWSIVSTDNGYFKIINRNSGLALDINQASTNNGTAAIQWTYGGSDNQQWDISVLENGKYVITNKNSKQSLDVNQGSTAAGGTIIQWPWNGGNNQQWTIAQ
ncbi:RICIN domain-containing protein [Mucilaginibacter terrae]|uniref:Endoglucanase n=1 Tax=Mucilaginibacter terrae TaxID=1955052 RepID=A0ABU3H0C9_9SPHI|nr:RICIN domain-containing protein [Mucilaginibacter terrae]MDT3405469.1 endoglucanase [Mucilaginibacter terrae]